MFKDIDKLQYFFLGNLVGLVLMVAGIALHPMKQPAGAGAAVTAEGRAATPGASAAPAAEDGAAKASAAPIPSADAEEAGEKTTDKSKAVRERAQTAAGQKRDRAGESKDTAGQSKDRADQSKTAAKRSGSGRAACNR